MSDEPLLFNLIFTIPQLDSAFMRNPAGGARMKIDIQTETVEDANRMLDLMVSSAGVTFAAAVVVVNQFKEISTDERETRSETEQRSARRPTGMARRRVQRPTD
jgi:hypothetical protein